MHAWKRLLAGIGVFLTITYVATRSGSRPPPLAVKGRAGSLSSESSAAPQGLLADPSKYSLYEQLAYQFPYDLESPFPAFVWQTWKHAPESAKFENKFRAAEASWSEKHPEYIHEVVTDEFAVHLLRHLYVSVPEVLEAFQALPLPVLKADFFRYLILLARGGIYSDIDTLALKPAAQWIPAHVPRESIGLVVGIEADPDRPDWADWYARRIQFCQWTIQAKPGHPVLRAIVANMTAQTLGKKERGELGRVVDDDVMDFSGPGLWTNMIFAYLNDARYFETSGDKRVLGWRNFTGITSGKKIGDVVVLPITSFSPGVGQMGAKGVGDPMAFVHHQFEGSWKPESERMH